MSANCAILASPAILPAPRVRILFDGFDSSYCARLRDGDPDTERHFVTYFAPLLLAKLRRRLRSSALIDEIRQETFLRTFRAIRTSGGVREPKHLGAFVYGVCENTIREYERSNRRMEPMADEAESRPGTGDTPEQEVITEERKQIVRQIVDQLSPRDRTVLRAVFFEERDKDEVCRELGVDRTHLRVLLHRAKLQFRTMFIEREAVR